MENYINKSYSFLTWPNSNFIRRWRRF